MGRQRCAFVERRPSPPFTKTLSSFGKQRQRESMDRIQIVRGDVLTQKGDVLVLKYAQQFYGVDAAVVRVLDTIHPRTNMKPKPGRFVVLPTKDSMKVPFVMFLGVVDLGRFDYGQIRSFSYLALQVLKSQLPEARRILMTVHGPGYGLDEKEAFLALCAGLRDAFADGAHPARAEDIQIVEHNRGRVQRLSRVLGDLTEILEAPSASASCRKARRSNRSWCGVEPQAAHLCRNAILRG